MSSKINNEMGKVVIMAVFIMLVSGSMLLVVSLPPSRGDPPFSVNTNVSTDLLDMGQTDAELALNSNGDIYVVWQDDRSSDFEIYFAGSTDAGASWTDPNVRVNTGGAGTVQQGPAIAANDTHIFVAWEDLRSGNSDIYFASSDDGGATWTNPNNKINSDITGLVQSSPALAVDSNGIIYAVWSDFRNTDGDIYFARSTDGGTTWTDPNVKVNQDTTTTRQQIPTIAVNDQGTLICVAWEDEINGNKDINFSKSVDGGATWSNPSIKINSDTSTEDQRFPHISLDANDNIYLAWQDWRHGDWDIYFAKSSNEGNTWTEPNVKINSDGGVTDQLNPSMAIGLNNHIYVAWHDRRLGDNDIFFAESTDSGATWTDPNLRVNDDITADQFKPSLGVDFVGRVFIAWEDFRNSNYDIYFSILDPGAFPPPKPTADGLGVDGFLQGSDGIDHIVTDEPVFNFTYNDFTGDDLESYNISLWDAAGPSMLWYSNTTDTSSPGSNIEVTYNGPPLEDGETYNLRVRVANASNVWSAEYEVDFHINEVLAPDIPVSPQDDTLIAVSDTQTVSWTPPPTDSEGDTPVSYSWEIASDSAFSDIIASGSGAANESDAFDANTVGVYYWRVNLNDGYETGPYGNEPDGFWNFTTFNATASNHEPVITNKDSAPTSAAINTTLSFSFTATDADSDTLTWSMVAGVLWLEIGPANGTLYGTPTSDDKGEHVITIQATDQYGGTDTHTFTITVSDATDGDGDGDGDSDFPWLWIIIIIVIIIIVIVILFMRRI